MQAPGSWPSVVRELADVWEPKPGSGKVTLPGVRARKRMGWGRVGGTERMMDLRASLLVLYDN